MTDTMRVSRATFGAAGGPLRHVAGDEVALTFDDGPDLGHTPPLLDLLAAHGVHASFFVIGERAVRYPALIRRMLDEGHVVGSHGWRHLHAWRLSQDAARGNVIDGAQALGDLCGRPVRWFRPPYGRMRPCLVEAAAAAGQRVVLWSRSAIDWGPFGTRRAVTRRLARIAPGDIVLMHDAEGQRARNRPAATLAALPTVFEGLADRRIRYVSLDTSQCPTLTN